MRRSFPNRALINGRAPNAGHSRTNLREVAIRGFESGRLRSRTEVIIDLELRLLLKFLAVFILLHNVRL